MQLQSQLPVAQPPTILQSTPSASAQPAPSANQDATGNPDAGVVPFASFNPPPTSEHEGDQINTELLHMLTDRAVEIEVLKRKLDEFVSSDEVVKQEKLNWGLWMASVIAQVSDNRWAEFQQRSLSFMREFVTPTVRTTTCATTTANNSASIVTSAPLFIPTIACSARTTVVSGTVISTSAPNPSAQPL